MSQKTADQNAATRDPRKPSRNPRFRDAKPGQRVPLHNAQDQKEEGSGCNCSQPRKNSTSGKKKRRPNFQKLPKKN
ncbi:hypothetical protein M5D96_013167 [Drosophila gunungcola]|uniref:Uncharacterized protein n=1 Tax=Drosophila gunungcola TaxID=103775 RepID=A0A9P9YBW7_9MUSC|nr:hypothetical protein M5D96_013167 [Drosophila gunungcola]